MGALARVRMPIANRTVLVTGAQPVIGCACASATTHMAGTLRDAPLASGCREGTSIASSARPPWSAT
jgi:hypothetical protein